MNLLIIRNDMVIFGPATLNTKEAVVGTLILHIPLRVVKSDDGYTVEFEGKPLPREYGNSWASGIDVLYDYFQTGLSAQLPGYQLLKIKD